MTRVRCATWVGPVGLVVAVVVLVWRRRDELERWAWYATGHGPGGAS